LGLFSYGCGKALLKEANPPPPPVIEPSPFTLFPTQVEFLKQYLGNEVILTLRYDIPTNYDKGLAQPLHTMLSLDTDEIIDSFIEQCEAIYLAADEKEQERLRAEGQMKINPDLIECLLVPRFGRAVYESKIPVFRFKITAKSPRSLREHDIEVGDIIDGNIR
jgi:hypothetical protein